MTQPATSIPQAPAAPIVQAQPQVFSWFQFGKSALALVGLGFLAWFAWRKLPAAAVENPFEEVQSLLFQKEHGWTAAKAKAWAKKHGYKHGKVDVTDAYVRLRQEPPEHFEVLRTVPFGKGIKAVTGR